MTTAIRSEFMRRLCLFAAAHVFFAAMAPRAVAQQQQERQDREARTPEAKSPDGCDAAATKEDSSVTDHTIRLGGQSIPYKATAGFILLKNDKGEPTGLMYSVAYTRTDVKDVGTRPVAFLYNGGPGSA